MKLHILSDLHLEFAPFDPPDTDADVVLLAGDIHVGNRGLGWIKKAFQGKEVIYVTGNHEYYRESIPELTIELKQLSEDAGIHFLENESVTIGNVTFLGCTLWSDFELLGNRDIAMSAAQSMMNDYRLIRVGKDGRRLRPLDTELLHIKSRKWLGKKLDNLTAHDKTVVVTHHAPSMRSISEQYKYDPMTAAFASDMETFVADSGIDLWVHGHLHHATDYAIGNTRVLCNPRGYPDQKYAGFKPGLVIEL